MTDATLVPIFPWPLTPERDTLLRAAKALLDTDVKMLPVPAVAGSPDRTLCFGSPPPWVSDSVVIHPDNVDKLDSIQRALDFLLHTPQGTPGSFDHAAWLSAVMKCDVKFVGEEPYPNPADAANPYVVEIG